MENYKGSFNLNNKEVKWQTTFSKKIKFNCSKSGLCCMATNVELFDEDVSLLQKAAKKDFVQYFINPITKLESKRIKDSDKKDCLFLSRNVCSVYDNRPHSCRLFPFKVIFYHEDEVYIDIVYGCKSVSNNQFSETNLVNFDEIVRKEMIMIGKLGLNLDATADLSQTISRYNKDFEFAKNLFKRSILSFKYLKKIDDLYHLLSGIQAIKMKLKEDINEENLFNLGLGFFRQNEQNFNLDEVKIDSFLKTVFFKAYDLNKGLRYKIQIYDKVYFHYEDGGMITQDFDELSRVNRILDEYSKKSLIEYLIAIIERKTTEILFYREVNKIKEDVDIVILFLELFKKIVKHMNTLLLLSSLKDGCKITTNTLSEVIMMYDNIALHAPSIFLSDMVQND